ELLKVDVAPLVPKLRKNMTTHIDYIRHTLDEAATLKEIVESKRLLSPLNTSFDYACKYTRRIQELLMILQQTCPSLTELGTKLVAVTPKNKTKQIRPTEQPRVILVSSASRSMSQDNTKKNRIQQTQRKAKKNKVEDHFRNVKSSLNKKSVVDSKATSSVLNSEKVLVITAFKDTLSKLKGKAIVNEAVILHPIDPELLKIDVAPLALKLRNNRTAHNDYLKHTQEETATLREIVKNERLLNPLNTSLDYACKYTKRIQELLIILKQTCPCINDLGTKLMAVTPVNNNKKIRFTEHIPSSGNTPIKTTSFTNVVSNKHVLSSTGVNLSASGSQPHGSTKKDRIQET
nr:hypothetical protein [Tanacetum cinerariifolium]